jgi:hypothetical protein
MIISDDRLVVDINEVVSVKKTYSHNHPGLSVYLKNGNTVEVTYLYTERRDDMYDRIVLIMEEKKGA